MNPRVTTVTTVTAARARKPSKAERVQWYSIAEAVPLSQRHTGHILGKLQKAAA